MSDIPARHRIELLAPARNAECARAAIDAGADAVYMGARSLGARASAVNTTADIAAAARYAHTYGARLYATLNTIVFESELDDARRLAEELIDAGVDAFIVQDTAYLRMGLDAEFHASTQMYNATPECVRFLGESGFARVVLERGLTLEQIEAIRRSSSVELEAFVHGAICVCGSGRCQMSRTMSARSGNRGECSQPCRQTYDLCDADGNTIIRGKHLLSVRDLDLSERLGDLLDAGVSSLKIEGRLKDIDYVRNITALYNRELNRQIALREGFERSSRGRVEADFEPDAQKSFTRGGSTYFLDGLRRGVASFDTPKALGEPIGRIVGRSAAGVFGLNAGATALHAGDGICFLAGGELRGTNVNAVSADGFTPNRPDGLVAGTEIFRNFDKEFSDRVGHSRIRRVIDIDVEVDIDADKVRFRFGDHIERTVANTFDRASDAARMEAVMRAQLAKTGGTSFVTRAITVNARAPMPFIPAAELNRLRREALTELAERLAAERQPRKTAVENPAAQLPESVLDGEWNVVNSLAESYYRSHGATSVERGYDLSADLTGVAVMRTPYCIRREIGECLRCGTKLRGELFLRRGANSYRLDFDCRKCEMKVVKI